MKSKKWIKLVFAVLIIGVIGFITWDVYYHKDYIDAFSGATPLALERKVPEGLSLSVEGRVKQLYRFTSRSFRLMSKVRIRTAEVDPKGEIMGTYIYTGVPVMFILEGVAPQKNKQDAFDRPLDMIVVFTSTEGKSAYFSYGELTTGTDSLPVTLAYHREPLKPTSSPETYKGNKYKGDIEGLHLICPREPNTERYLDNVVRIALMNPPAPDNLLPRTQKNKDCTGSTVQCIESPGDSSTPASFEGVEHVTISNWLRVGHGKGIKGDHLFSASGYQLQSFINKNFPGCMPEDFFLFVGCDGYRSIFSGREIFCTADGNSFLLITGMDGQPEKSGMTVGVTSDFFVDRCVREVTHIVRIKI